MQRSEGKGSLGGCERVCRSITGCGAKGGEVVKNMRQVRGVRRVQDICGACGFAWKGVTGRKKSKGWEGLGRAGKESEKERVCEGLRRQERVRGCEVSEKLSGEVGAGRGAGLVSRAAAGGGECK